MVNTFVIADTPEECAKMLDYKRLGKQRVEAKQIIDTLEHYDEKKGWKNHPALLMWKDNINALKYYYNCMVDEWIFRGYKNEMKKYDIKGDVVYPWWFHNKYVQLSHKCSLYRKNTKYYRNLTIDNEFLKVGYIWPSSLTESQIEILKVEEIKSLPETKSIKEILKMCSELGTGTPAHWRISLKQVIQWRKNKLINPKTNRKISKNGSIYKDYKEAENFHLRDPIIKLFKSVFSNKSSIGDIKSSLLGKLLKILNTHFSN